MANNMISFGNAKFEALIGLNDEISKREAQSSKRLTTAEVHNIRVPIQLAGGNEVLASVGFLQINPAGTKEDGTDWKARSDGQLKIHVSIHPGDIEKAWNAIASYCVEHHIVAKFMANILDDGSYLVPEKTITLYTPRFKEKEKRLERPADMDRDAFEREWAGHVESITGLLREAGVRAGSPVRGDACLGAHVEGEENYFYWRFEKTIQNDDYDFVVKYIRQSEAPYFLGGSATRHVPDFLCDTSAKLKSVNYVDDNRDVKTFDVPPQSLSL